MGQLSLSDQVKATDGVKQGGILSPILFIVYIDELLLKLKDSRIGCHTGSTFCGALGYDEFGKQFNATFSALKYQLLVYSNSDNQIEGLNHNGIFIRALPYADHQGRCSAR